MDWIDNSNLDIGDNPAKPKSTSSHLIGPFSLAQHVKLRLYFKNQKQNPGKYVMHSLIRMGAPEGSCP